MSTCPHPKIKQIGVVGPKFFFACGALKGASPRGPCLTAQNRLPWASPSYPSPPTPRRHPGGGAPSAWSQSGCSAIRLSGRPTGPPRLAEMLNLKSIFSSSLSPTRAALSCLPCSGHTAHLAEALLSCAAAYGGRGWLHAGPQDTGGRLRAACCVSAQLLRRRAAKELLMARPLLDAWCSKQWLFRLSEDRFWVVSHGPEASCYNSACT